MSQIMDEAAWKGLSGDFPWSEQLLDKYRDTVDWDEVSTNGDMLWTTLMLEKFAHRLDWDALSPSGHQGILTADLFERFKGCWNWSELSGSTHIEMACEQIDRFLDRAFFERYEEYIPASALQDSRLWRNIVE